MKIKPLFFFVIIPAVLMLTGLSSCHTPYKISGNQAHEDSIEINLRDVKIVAEPQYKGTPTKYFDLLHMYLHVTPVWTSRSVDGTAVLTLTPHAYRQDTLVLDAKDFDIKNIAIVDSKGKEIVKPEYRYDRMQLHIACKNRIGLDHKKTDPNDIYQADRYTTGWYSPGDTFSVKIDYSAWPERQYKDSVITKKMEQGLYFINPDLKDSIEPREIWSQGETEHNSAWFPTIEATDQKMTQEVDITIDTAMTTLSNGLLMHTILNGDGTKTDHWRMDKPESPYLVMMAAGTYKIVKDNWRNIPVWYYVEPEYEPYARMIYGHTPAMIEYFSKLLKYDFPWPKYSQMVVRDFTSGAMENTTATLLYEPVQHDNHQHADDDQEEVISHELFHHWFGDLVTCKNWANLALNESFAAYSEYLWEAHEYTADDADLMLKQDMDNYFAEAVYHKGPIIEHYYNDPEDLFDKHRYEKGALVLNMLRHEVGDTVFFGALHNYLVAHAWKNAEIADLREAMEAASGKDLNWFFSQWFETPGHPVLEIRQKYDTAARKLTVYVAQKQKDDRVPLFHIPVEIGLNLSCNNEGVPVVYRRWLEHTKDSFTFDISGACHIRNVNFDPSKYLLCQRSEIKPYSQWMYQLMNNDKFLNRYEAMMALVGRGNTLKEEDEEKVWNKLLTDHSWYIRKMAISLLADQPEKLYSRFTDKIQQMALADEKSLVRAFAVQFVADKEKERSIPVLEKSLSDSSYAVMAASINGLFSQNPREDSARLMIDFQRFEKYTRSNDVMSALCNAYSWYGDASKAYFFTTQRNFSGSYFDSYLRYLKRLGPAMIRKQKDYILNIDSRLKSTYDSPGYQGFLYKLAKVLRKAGGEDNDKLAKVIEDKARATVIRF